MSVPRLGVPFAERGGPLRGAFDLVAGRYPAFLFGGRVGSHLPVFHFHEVTRSALEPAFAYLAENGYAAVGSEELRAFVREGRHPGSSRVMLAFDDALASVWIVAAPLLRAYGLRAVTYAIPGRLRDGAMRPTIEKGAVDVEAIDVSEDRFMRWSELRALSDSGLVEVQSHTFSHSLVFTGSRIVDFVSPTYARESLFHRPRTGSVREAHHLSPDALGHPLFARRSRMSDGRRFLPDQEGCARLVQYVAGQGGAQFFERATWRRDLTARGASIGGRWETDAERQREIEEELALSRDMLSTRLGRPVLHACLPWGVSGRLTRAVLERVGYQTAFANQWQGRLIVSAGDDPYFLKRLDNRFVFTLPGKERRRWLFNSLRSGPRPSVP